MNSHVLGQISQITRYPVKSMAGEGLTQTQIAAYGVYGDRSHAFIDASKEGWDRYFTARHTPNLLGYKAVLKGEAAEDAFPQLQVTSPAGELFQWDEHLLAQIQPYAKRPLSMIRHQPGSEQLLAVDTGAILMTTDRTLARLNDLLGTAATVDQRRFRPNLVVALHEHAVDETQWMGRRLKVGSVLLEIVEPCERCSMITIDPDTLDRNSAILRKVNEEMGLHFGVYASVVATGQVSQGDQVEII